MDISLLLISGFGGFLEIHRLLGMLMLKTTFPIIESLHKVRPEENKKVENGHKGKESADPIPGQQTGNNIQGKESRIDPCQPFHLYRKDIKEKDLHIRVKDGEGKEQGEVDIMHGGVSRDQAIDNIQNNASQVEHTEPGCAPFPLQKIADPVVKIGGEDHEENAGTFEKQEIAALRKKYKGNESPDLPVKNIIPGKIQKGGDPDAQAEGVQQVDHYIPDGDIQHQVRDAEMGMVPAEFIDPLFDRSHGKNLLG